MCLSCTCFPPNCSTKTSLLAAAQRQSAPHAGVRWCRKCGLHLDLRQVHDLTSPVLRHARVGHDQMVPCLEDDLGIQLWSMQRKWSTRRFPISQSPQRARQCLSVPHSTGCQPCNPCCAKPPLRVQLVFTRPQQCCNKTRKTQKVSKNITLLNALRQCNSFHLTVPALQFLREGSSPHPICQRVGREESRLRCVPWTARLHTINGTALAKAEDLQNTTHVLPGAFLTKLSSCVSKTHPCSATDVLFRHNGRKNKVQHAIRRHLAQTSNGGHLHASSIRGNVSDRTRSQPAARKH